MSRDAPPIQQDNLRRPEPPASAGGVFADTVMALRFFSVLPTGDSPHETPNLSRIALALPLASVIIGIGPALVVCLGTLVGLPGLFAAALAIALHAVLTGGMTEDAMADSADGLFGGRTPERRLEIMKDSRHGTYGVLAIAVFVTLRVVGLGALAAANPLAAGALLMAIMVLSRSAGLWTSVRLTAARSTGAGASAGPLPLQHFGFGLGLALVLFLILAGPFAGYIGLALALLAALGAATGWTALCRRLVGGQTGDLVGAGIGIIEISALTMLLTTT